MNSQQHTTIDLKKKLKLISSEKNNDILIEVDSEKFIQEDFNNIQQISKIIQDSGEVGEFELGNLKIKINKIKTYEKDLIICKKQ